MSAIPATPDRVVRALAMAAAGTPNAEIGAQLGVSEDVAKKIIQRCCRRLGAANRAQAVVLALVCRVLVFVDGSVVPGPVRLRDAVLPGMPS